MRCLVGIDDTDSSRGSCTTYLAFRIACDLSEDLAVLPYPRLVRLNPNIPFKTRGNAAVCLQVETDDPRRALRALSSKLSELSDVQGGANSGLVFLEDEGLASSFRQLYHDAITGVVNPARVSRLLQGMGVRYTTLGNGMGIVGATAALGFSVEDDHTFELISYRPQKSWGSRRLIDSASVKEMDGVTFPHTFNNYDYQKRKVLISPHGPDPVFAGVRGDSPTTVLRAFSMLRFDEELEGYIVYLTNQHTDAHLHSQLDWKVFSSGWTEGTVDEVETGPGGHVYLTLQEKEPRRCAFYEPTGDLRRVAKGLQKGDRVRLSGGVRRGTSAHVKILNVERMEVISLAHPPEKRSLVRGTYIASPRANRHLTKPLIRYGRESTENPLDSVPGWLKSPAMSTKVLSRNRR